MGETRSIEIQQLRELKGPLVDVRSPSEFAKGHWPGAINLLLFNDEERAASERPTNNKDEHQRYTWGLNSPAQAEQPGQDARDPS